MEARVTRRLARTSALATQLGCDRTRGSVSGGVEDVSGTCAALAAQATVLARFAAAAPQLDSIAAEARLLPPVRRHRSSRDVTEARARVPILLTRACALCVRASVRMCLYRCCGVRFAGRVETRAR